MTSIFSKSFKKLTPQAFSVVATLGLITSGVYVMSTPRVGHAADSPTGQASGSERPVPADEASTSEGGAGQAGVVLPQPPAVEVAHPLPAIHSPAFPVAAQQAASPTVNWLAGTNTLQVVLPRFSESKDSEMLNKLAYQYLESQALSEKGFSVERTSKGQVRLVLTGAGTKVDGITPSMGSPAAAPPSEGQRSSYPKGVSVASDATEVYLDIPDFSASGLEATHGTYQSEVKVGSASLDIDFSIFEATVNTVGAGSQVYVPIVQSLKSGDAGPYTLEGLESSGVAGLNVGLPKGITATSFGVDGAIAGVVSPGAGLGTYLAAVRIGRSSKQLNFLLVHSPVSSGRTVTKVFNKSEQAGRSISIWPSGVAGRPPVTPGDYVIGYSIGRRSDGINYSPPPGSSAQIKGLATSPNPASPSASGGSSDLEKVQKILPLGLSFNPRTGAISGVPSPELATGRYVYDVNLALVGSNQLIGYRYIFDVVGVPQVTYNFIGVPRATGYIASTPPNRQGGDQQPLTYALSGVPGVLQGIRIDPNSGVISGRLVSSDVPEGLYTVTVEITNTLTGGKTSVQVSVGVGGSVSIPSAVNYANNIRATSVYAGVPYRLTPSVTSGKALFWSISTSGYASSDSVHIGLPEGLSLDPNTGVISGVVPAGVNGPRPGAFFFVLEAHSLGGTVAKQQVQLYLNQPLTASPHTLILTPGQAVVDSQALHGIKPTDPQVVGGGWWGDFAYTYDILSGRAVGVATAPSQGGLPSGLVMGSDGSVTGAVSSNVAYGLYKAPFTFKDIYGDQASVVVSVEVAPKLCAVTGLGSDQCSVDDTANLYVPPSGSVNQRVPINAGLQGVKFTEYSSASATEPSSDGSMTGLPKGLRLSSDGVLLGTLDSTVKSGLYKEVVNLSSAGQEVAIVLAVHVGDSLVPQARSLFESIPQSGNSFFEVPFDWGTVPEDARKDWSFTVKQPNPAVPGLSVYVDAGPTGSAVAGGRVYGYVTPLARAGTYQYTVKATPPNVNDQASTPVEIKYTFSVGSPQIGLKSPEGAVLDPGYLPDATVGGGYNNSLEVSEIQGTEPSWTLGEDNLGQKVSTGATRPGYGLPKGLVFAAGVLLGTVGEDVEPGQYRVPVVAEVSLGGDAASLSLKKTFILTVKPNSTLNRQTFTLDYSPYGVVAPVGGAVSLKPLGLPERNLTYTAIAPLYSDPAAAPPAILQLPRGLSLDPNTGAITGTIAEDAKPGQYRLAVQAVNPSNGRLYTTPEDKNISITVVKDGPVLRSKSVAIVAGGEVNLVPEQTSGPGITGYKLVSVDGSSEPQDSLLPKGLSFDSKTGVISGTADAGLASGRSWSLAIVPEYASNGNTILGAAAQYQITVVAPLAYQNQRRILYTGTQEVLITQSPSVPVPLGVTAGYPEAVTQGLTLGSDDGRNRVPAGLVLYRGGALAGTIDPNQQPGTYTFTVLAIAAGEPVASANYTIVVEKGPDVSYPYTDKDRLIVRAGTKLSATPKVGNPSVPVTYKVTKIDGKACGSDGQICSVLVNPETGVFDSELDLAKTGIGNHEITVEISPALPQGANPLFYPQPQIAVLYLTVADQPSLIPQSFEVVQGGTLPQVPINPYQFSGGAVTFGYGRGNTGFGNKPKPGVVPLGLNLDDKGGEIFGTLANSVTPGVYTFWITLTGKVGTPVEVLYAVRVLPLQLSPSFSGTVGKSLDSKPVSTRYAYAFADGVKWGDFPYSNIVPAGLYLNSVSGQIVGQVGSSVAPGTYTFDVNLENSPLKTVQYTVTVAGDTGLVGYAAQAVLGEALAASAYPLPEAQTASFRFGETVAAAKVVGRDAVPEGVVLNPRTGALLGAPAQDVAPGLYRFPVVVSQASRSETVEYSLLVKPKMLSLETAAVVGGEVSTVAQAGTGQNSPVSFAISSQVSPGDIPADNVIPTGLSVSPTGQIVGTVGSQVSPGTYTFAVVPSVSAVALAPLVYTVQVVGLSPVTLAVSRGETLSSVSNQPEVVNPQSGLRYAFGNGVEYSESPGESRLPGGLFLDATNGGIAGTVSASAANGVYSFPVSVFVGDSLLRTLTYQLWVGPAAVSLTLQPQAYLSPFKYQIGDLGSGLSNFDFVSGTVASLTPGLNRAPFGLLLSRSRGFVQGVLQSNVRPGVYVFQVRADGASQPLTYRVVVLPNPNSPA